METATETRPLSTKDIQFMVTSAFASAVGVVVAVFADDLGVALAGMWADRMPVLYHNQTVYSAPGSDLALAGGMALCLLVGAFFLALYPGSRRHDAARLTVLWVTLHCFRQGFSQLAAVPFDGESDVTQAFATLDVPAGLDLVVSVAGAIGLIAVALASAPAFLGYAHHSTLIDTPSRRFLFAVRLALVPGLVGPLLAVPVFLPDNGAGLVPSLPLFGVFTVATVLAAIGTRTVQVGDRRQATGWSWLPVVWLVVFALVSQLLLRRGLIVPPSLADPFVDPM